MQRVERTARIAAAPDELFAYLADLDNLPDWQSGIVRAERIDHGPLQVGSSARVVRELMGQRLEVVLTITEYEPPHRLGIGSEASGVKVQAALELSPTDADTATDLAFAMEIRGSMLTAFMEPMIAGAAKGDIDASLRRLEGRFAERSER